MLESKGKGREIEGFYWCNTHKTRYLFQVDLSCMMQYCKTSKPSPFRCHPLDGPTPLVLAVPRARFRGVRAGASEELDSDDSDVDLDLHWPQGPPAGHATEQQVSSATLRRGKFFLKTNESEHPTVESRHGM